MKMRKARKQFRIGWHQSSSGLVIAGWRCVTWRNEFCRRVK